jgi:hypothetical protein
MEKFENQTIQGNEKAIKIGSKSLSDSIPLAWFSSDKMTPSNTLSISDVSYLIPENVIGNIEGESLAYADELGVLRKINGSSKFKTNNLTVSNIFINKPSYTERLDINTLEFQDFSHYFYISRFFIAAPKDYSASSIRQYIDQEKFVGLNILVTRPDGSDYVNVAKSTRKYRILLEPFKTEYNIVNDVIPYRIIVLFDSDQPKNIRLTYDKVQCDDRGLIFDQQINYSETINAVPIFKEKAEESFVLDKNYFNSQIFAVKKFNQKYSELALDKVEDDGYQVFVPSKAIEDTRSYEVFNWRLIAKSNSSVSLNEEDFPSNDDLLNYRTVNVGVLYSSRFSSSVHDPYIFYRLENSPFNLSKFKFVNPLSDANDAEKIEIERPLYIQQSSIEKNQKNYWLVDIETEDLSNYDILAFEPSFDLSVNHVAKLKSFVANNGSLMMDLSRSRNGVSGISGLSISSDNVVKMSSHRLNTESEIIDSTKNGGWTINDVGESSIFEKAEYSIHGTSKFDSGEYKNTKYFSNYLSSSEFDRYSYFITHNSQPTGIHIISKSTGDRLTGGNIFATSFPFFRYCNDQFSVTGSDNVIRVNNGDYSIDSGLGNLFSAVVEGPFKALYNMVCYSLYSRMAIKGSRVDFRSPLYNYVSDWRSGWVMDTSVLLDEEKANYFSSISISPTNSISGLDILKNEKVNSDIFNFYKNEISNFITDKQKSRLSSMDSSEIDFYIEVTNPDVEIYNAGQAERVASNFVNGLSSSYYLYKISTPSAKTFAYTTVSSPELRIPDNLGPYIIIEKPLSTSNNILINDAIDRNAAFKDYKFDINSYYNYYSASDSPQSYTAYTGMNGSARLTGIEFKTGYYQAVDPIEYPGVFGQTKSWVEVPASDFRSAVDDIGLFRATSTTQPTNVFPYTGDIDLGNTWKIWRYDISSSNHVNRGAFATYVQFTLWTYNNFYSGTRNYYPYSLDQYYGPATASGVRSFQSAEKLRYIDGRVDSETKWYLASFWKRVYSQRRDIYDEALRYISSIDSKVYQYIEAARRCAVAAEINSKTYKKTTFSGVVNPKEARDVIFFKLPESLTSISELRVNIDPSWANCRVVGYGLATSRASVESMPGINVVNKTPVNGVIKISLPDIKPAQSNAKYMWIEIYGDSISNTSFNNGYAEGFAIKSIKCYGYTYVTEVIEEPRYEEQPDVWVPRIENKVGTFTFVIEDYPKIVNPSEVVTHSIYSLQSYYDLIRRSSRAYIKSITIDSKTYNFEENEYSLKDIFFNSDENLFFEDAEFRINFSSTFISSPSILEYEISKIIDNDTNIGIWEKGDNVDASPVVLDSPYSVPGVGIVLRYQTSNIYYSNSQVVRVGPTPMPEGYSLRSIDGAILYTGGKNSVNVNDGVLLLCDSSGDPIGFPSSSVINSGLKDVNSTLDDEVDTRFGFFSIVNFELLEDGFIYGFYDIDKKEFIGTTISYVELIQRNSGGNNVYIGVLAYDADGNTGNIDFIGPSKDITFTPVTIPLKYVAPVYSVAFRSESAIRVGNLSSSLSKFDAWELPVSSGSFSKMIKIPNNYYINDWKKNYLGQEILAFYETSRSKMSDWSDIYGYGSYDISNENPTIIDNERIQLNKAPILSWNHPTNYSESIFGIVKPVVVVYFKNRNTGSWDVVPENYIKNIDCFNGVIEFIPRVLPSELSEIKVDYSVENKDILIRQIDGSPVPINPFLNNVDYKKPLYIYILPRKVYTFDNFSKKYIFINDYENTNSVNYTYNSDIFNKKSTSYNPFALPIAIISINGNPNNKIPHYIDVRTRGGGLVDDVSIVELMEYSPDVLNNWDIYPPSSMAYPNGGYVIIRIPREVENNFLNKTEVYEIIRSNLTAGVVFELQDLEGNSWS